MITVLGSSHEKVELKDLGDTIYYHQKKTYTDQQFESSRDLRREISSGRLTKLKEFSTSSNTVTDIQSKAAQVSNTSLSIHDIKAAMKESMTTVTDMFPMMLSMIKQEITDRLSSITVSGSVTGSSTRASSFVGPEYIPDVNTEGMVVGNIKAEEKQVSGAGMDDALAALKNMKIG